MKKIKQQFTLYKNFFFLRRNFFLLAVLAGIAYYWINHHSGMPGSAARVQIVLSAITIAFCGLVLLFSLLSDFPAYLAFWFKKRILEEDPEEREDVIKVRFLPESAQPASRPAEIRVYGLRKPWFGYVRVKLIYQDGQQSEDILLDQPIIEAGKKRGMMSTKAIAMPNIKDYRIRAAFIFFEDFFHLFAFPYREDENQGIFIEAPVSDQEPVPIKTDHAQDPVLKVQRHRFAKGEPLDYKKYTPGDDIRRIIWKNYARSRELTVRIHDRNFPYVSHINLLASFYDGTSSTMDLEIKTLLLDTYKEKLRQVIDSILEQGFSVQFIPDQPLGTHYVLEEYEKILYQISACNWQGETPPEQFVEEQSHRMRGATNLLMTSSLCAPEHLQSLRNGRARSLNFIYYQMSKTLGQSQSPSWLKQLFFVDIYPPLEAARRKPNARGTIRRIYENDQRFRENILSKTEVIML